MVKRITFVATRTYELTLEGDSVEELKTQLEDLIPLKSLDDVAHITGDFSPITLHDFNDIEDDVGLSPQDIADLDEVRCLPAEDVEDVDDDEPEDELEGGFDWLDEGDA